MPLRVSSDETKAVFAPASSLRHAAGSGPPSVAAEIPVAGDAKRVAASPPSACTSDGEPVAPTQALCLRVKRAVPVDAYRVPPTSRAARIDSVPESPPLSADHEDPTKRHIPALGVPPATLPSETRARVVGRTPRGRPADALEEPTMVGPEREKDVTSQFVAAKRLRPADERARTSPHPVPAAPPDVEETSVTPAPRAETNVPVGPSTLATIATSEMVAAQRPAPASDHEEPMRR
jgi:hypothetical protein